MSKAFRYHQHGGPEVLRFEDVEVGPPGPGQVRIRNKAVAVNFRDVLLRKGIHAVKSFPAGIGLESAGVIDAVGPDVERLHGRRPRRLCGHAGRLLRRGAHRPDHAPARPAGRHRRAHRRLDDGPRHDRALAALRRLQGASPATPS